MGQSQSKKTGSDWLRCIYRHVLTAVILNITKSFFCSSIHPFILFVWKPPYLCSLWGNTTVCAQAELTAGGRLHKAACSISGYDVIFPFCQKRALISSKTAASQSRIYFFIFLEGRAKLKTFIICVFSTTLFWITNALSSIV